MIRGDRMVFAIADLHFDSVGDKPMDIFGQHWIGHEDKIMESWKKLVGEDDLVLLPGDISWALKYDEAYEDLKKIEELPGRKLMIKGNHDYWWVSLKKLNEYNFKTIDFLQNNNYSYGGVVVAGTRGWTDIDIAQGIEDGDDEHNEKIFKREIHRLRLSLDSIKDEYETLIVMLHYPPFDINLEPNKFGEILEEYNVDICIYGHLHGDGHKYVKEGKINGVEYVCVASDFINFIPKKIM